MSTTTTTKTTPRLRTRRAVVRASMTTPARVRRRAKLVPCPGCERGRCVAHGPLFAEIEL